MNALEMVCRYLPILLLAFARVSFSAFSGEECLKAHNSFRSLHANTASLKYSLDLEKESQKFADQLANDDSKLPVPTRDLPKRKRRNLGPTTDPFFHKELWEGEILFPSSSRDLNKGKPVRIGESIHKFCCYSFPLCPREFFHNLNFPPSAKGVVGHFYKEIKNYDFAKGGRKSNIAEDQEIRHFTNIVWRRTTEVGCAQSKRNKKGCVYTVLRYRIEGSVGTEEDFKTNVHRVGPDDEKRKTSSTESSNTVMIAFIVIVVIVAVFIACALVYSAKKGKIRMYYDKYKMNRDAKKAEASLRNDGDEESGNRRPSIISRFSTRTRPSIYIIPNVAPPNTMPLQAREPAPVYQNLAVTYSPEQGAVTIVDKSSPTEKKVPPPRPASAVKADSPALRPHNSILSQGYQDMNQSSSQRHSLPSPPYVSVVRDNVFSESSPSLEQPSGTNSDPKINKPVPKPYVNLDYNNTPVGVQSGPSSNKSGPVNNEIRPPIPAPRSVKPPASNGVPKPAPRPTRPNPPQNQFQERQIVPGRASRTSKKNPNFRTLPLNDRGSLRRVEKTKSGPDSGDDNANTQVPFPSAAQKKVPLVPPAKKPKPDAAKKPLLPKGKLDVVEEIEEDTKRNQVAEMRRLLEKNSGK